MLNFVSSPKIGRALKILILPLMILLSQAAAIQSTGYIYLPLTITQDCAVESDAGDAALHTVQVDALPQPTLGMWLNAEELAALPMDGPAWDYLKTTADQPTPMPDLSDQNCDANVRVLAKALVYARTGQVRYRNEVVNALRIIAQNYTESGGRTLALGRELVAYVIAADLVDLGGVDAKLDGQFRSKLRALLTETLDDLTLQSTDEGRPNNWGTHAGASRAAIAIYLGDSVELERTAAVFHGWLGDRTAYSGFSYGDLSWQADPENPVGINPLGAMKDGHSIDGALPEEMRRGGPFQWPPVHTGYAWEGLQGALVQAELLQRAGYPAWEWEDRALLRAVEFLYDIGWAPTGDDEWQIWLINHAYGVSYATNPTALPGKNMGWTSWTHAQAAP